MSKEPIVIIGTGLAGYNVAKEFRKLDQETPLLLITQDDGHSYSKPMLSTGFTKKKSPDDLSLGDPAKMCEQLKASIRTNTIVDALRPEDKIIQIGDEELKYDKLVLATGALPNKLKFPGSDIERVISINDLVDYRNFRTQLEEGQHVLIMGAGLIGCEYANDLLNGGYRVTVVDPSESALNGLIPREAGDAVISGLSEAGAVFKRGRYVKDIQQDGDNPLSITLDDGEQISADLVISAIGLKPSLELAKTANLECNQGICVDRTLQTSESDIFAIGDCAEVDGRVLLYVLPLMASARALARTLNGEDQQVTYGVMPVATKTPACPVIVHPPLSIDGSWDIESSGNNVRGLFKDDAGNILGFVLTGEYISEKQSLAKQCPPIHSS